MKASAKTTMSLTACLVACMTLSGCKTLPYEKGAIWCNEPLVYVPPDRRHFDDRPLDVARRGYMYALAGAHVLQSDTPEDKQHYFGLPPRLKREGPTQDDPSSGFSASCVPWRMYSKSRRRARCGSGARSACLRSMAWMPVFSSTDNTTEPVGA